MLKSESTVLLRTQLDDDNVTWRALIEQNIMPNLICDRMFWTFRRREQNCQLVVSQIRWEGKRWNTAGCQVNGLGLHGNFLQVVAVLALVNTDLQLLSYWFAAKMSGVNIFGQNFLLVFFSPLLPSVSLLLTIYSSKHFTFRHALAKSINSGHSPTISALTPACSPAILSVFSWNMVCCVLMHNL